MSKRYLDTNLSADERAEAMLEELSIDEKVAQLNCIFPFDKMCYDFDTISNQVKNGMGQVSTLEMRRMKTLDEVVEWQTKVQSMIMDASPHHIPAIFHMEGLCGAFIQDAVSFPSGIGRGASWNPELEEKIAEIVSRQEAACGITHVFAPILDISRDSRMGRQGESYGEDPVLVSAMGVAYTRGCQKNKVAGRKTESVAKHFLGFHNSSGGIHGANSDTPPRLLQEIYGKSFQAAISKADLKGMMPCYCLIDGEPASTSYNYLTKLLREEMGFDGVCVSDYGAINNAFMSQGIGESKEEVGLLSLTAGVDMELPSVEGYNEAFKNLFVTNKADINILNKAVKRVLAAKFRMGLFEHPYALKGDELRTVFENDNDKEISLQSAKESMVLIKNNGVLPISRDIKKIALIGPHANSPRKFFGGYTHMCMMESTYAIANSIAGVSGCENTDNREIVTVPGTNIQSDETPEFDEILNRQKPGCKSLLDELKIQYPNADVKYAYGYPIAGEDDSFYAEALDIVKEADVVILTLGGKHGTCSMASMGEGVDATNINLPKCQDEFIRKVIKWNKPLIGVHFDGRPISSDVADEYLDAILEAWNPSEMGAEAVVSILTGEYNPGGKMPVTTAYNSGQIPIYYNHPYNSAWHQTGSIGFANYVDLPHTPRYYFGYGLSYTEFDYHNLSISKKVLEPYECIAISFEIENIGERKGDEVVQLYLRDIHASMARPVKELAGFKRITLKAGEKKMVTFNVNLSQLAFLDTNMKWKIEKGCIEIEIGNSSENIRLRDKFEIVNNGWVNGKERSFYAEVVVE